MLSFAQEQLVVALRSRQNVQPVRGGLKRRYYASEGKGGAKAGSESAAGGKQTSEETHNFRQALDSIRGGIPKGSAKGHPKGGLSDFKKSSARRFSGSKDKFSHGILKTKQDAQELPEERPPMRNSPDQVRQARQFVQRTGLDKSRGDNYGRSAPSSTPFNVTLTSLGRGTLDREGDDRMLSHDAGGDYPGRKTSRTGPYHDQQRKDYRSEGLMDEEELSRTLLGFTSPDTLKSKAAEMDAHRGAAGRTGSAADDDDMADMDSMGKSWVEEEAFGKSRFDEEDLEERLIDEVDKELASRSNVDPSVARAQVIANQKTFMESSEESGMVDDLPEVFYGREVAGTQMDPQTRRAIQEGLPYPFTMEEIMEGDAKEDVLDDSELTSSADVMFEDDVMKEPMPISQSSEIALHSEKGLLFGIVDMFDRMITEKQRKLLVQAKHQRRFELWRADSWQIRQKKFAARKKRTLERKKAAKALAEKRKADPNNMFYPELNIHLTKEELRNDLLRNAVSAAIANPTWDREHRRTFITKVQRDIKRLAQPLSDEAQARLNKLYHIPKAPPSDDPRTIEHMLGLPVTDWSLIMAQAERAMDPRDRVKRFEPSPFETRNNTRL